MHRAREGDPGGEQQTVSTPGSFARCRYKLPRRWARLAGDDDEIKIGKPAMSRAFVKESSESARPPERMVDEGPNPVTLDGMAQIDAHVARIEASLKTESNVLLRETLERDLRYWTVRKASAELAPPPSSEVVSFGSKVTIKRKGRTQTFRIVGVDEADPAHGLISFRSPLAAAVMGARAGDIIEANEPLGELTVLMTSN